MLPKGNPHGLVSLKDSLPKVWKNDMNILRCVPLLLVSVMACSSTAPEFDVTGQWDMLQTFTNGTIICETVGDVLLKHPANGPRFTGQRATASQVCTGNPPDGFIAAPPAGVFNADVNGSRVTMEIDFCEFDGMLENESQMSGTLECRNGLGGVLEVFTGTWQATRR